MKINLIILLFAAFATSFLFAQKVPKKVDRKAGLSNSQLANISLKLFLPSVVITQSSLPKVGSAPKAINDIPKDHWAHDSVIRLVDRKILSGNNDGKFEGQRPVSRFELAVALDKFIQQVEAGLKKGNEALNEIKVVENPTINAPKNHWAASAMKRLAKNGFLPINSKVLQGPSNSLTAKEIGEALGQVAIRLTDLVSHERPESDLPSTVSPSR